MKFFSAVLAAITASPVIGSHQNTDIYYHDKQHLGPGMWHFSPDGLTIYSVDGSTVLKAHRKASICKPYTSWRGDVSEDCYYFTQASDGHKYVWAGSLAGMNTVQAFDIDTGEYAGYIPTCSTPLDLEYHPSREEMWLRCAQEDADAGHEGEIDVFSSNSLSADFDHIWLNGTSRPYGRIAIHSNMGPYGYVSSYNLPYLAEIDLSTKEVSATYDLPKAQGSYDMTYSPINGHIYTRGRVCCSCGFPGSDNEECGSYTYLVNVTTGPTAGMMNVNGTCGSGCEGSSADTLGVFEFDTVSKTIVANHNPLEGTGYGADPVSSPNGEHILLFPNDGGSHVRILKSGEGGAASALVHDVPVAFEGGLPGKTVVSDFAFVTDESRNILILGADTDNDVVLVDLLDDSFPMRKLQLTPSNESTGGARRNIEWAVGSDYVWVDGGATDEMYIINIGSDINEAKVVRQLLNITAGQMLYVENYARKRLMDDIRRESETVMSFSQSDKGSAEHKSDDDIDPVGIAALVIGCSALLLGSALAVLAARGPSPSIGEPRRDNDTKTLGSKQVN